MTAATVGMPLRARPSPRPLRSQAQPAQRNRVRPSAAGLHPTRRIRTRAQEPGREESGPPTETPAEPEASPAGPPPTTRRKGPKRQADSTDWVASALTRRFGLAGGLGWLGILTFGVVSEQLKTRREVAEEERGMRDVEVVKQVTKPNGLKYSDLKIGGGSYPVRGYLTVVDFKVSANGETIFDTKQRGKPYVFIYGARPFTGGICAGVEDGLADMRAGGRRLLVVPPELGFGSARQAIGDAVVPPSSELEYDITLQRISIPPS
eukprot:jgi/Tetstr1/448324/TSEL_035608.t1